MKEPQPPRDPFRKRVSEGLSRIEDIGYVGLGILLTVSAVALLIDAGATFVAAIGSGDLSGQIVGLLDRILLTLLVIELLYTVKVSFGEHGLLAEPFLVVALIAVIRRVLVITAELPDLAKAEAEVFRHGLLELALLTVMILVLVGSLMMLRKRSGSRAAASSESGA